MQSQKPMSNLDTFQAVATEAAVTSAATKWGMGGGSITAIYGWITSSGAVALIGIAVTILGFIVNGVYQRRRDRREEQQLKFNQQLELAEERRREEIHVARMAAMRKAPDEQVC